MATQERLYLRLNTTSKIVVLSDLSLWGLKFLRTEDPCIPTLSASVGQ